MNTPTPAQTSFDSLGIAPKLLEILTKNKFVSPTPIQQQSIPAAIEGKDMIGIAQTGTGKTLAFGVPMIQRLAQSKGRGKGLVVLPTRELALQVNDTLKKIGASIGLKTAILIGGEAMGKQIRALKQNPHIIIATPGRLIDHLENKTVNLTTTMVLVLDEADRMLDMGFAPQINKILENVPRDRQTLLFSATMPEAIVKIANTYLSSPLRVEVAPAGSAVKSVTQEIFFIDRNEKFELLKKLLSEYKGSVLVFCRTKFGAKKVAATIRRFGDTAAEIHSNRSLNQRLEALQGFKIGTYRVLVATDIAARGIDVTGIQLVVNYDLPDNAEDYVHRIGRTGRAAMTGHAISFATHDQRRDVNMIERLIRRSLPVSKTPALPKTIEKEDLPRYERDEREPRRDNSRRESGRGNFNRNAGRATSNRSISSRPQRKSFSFADRGGQRPSYKERFSSSNRPERNGSTKDSPRDRKASSAKPFRRRSGNERRKTSFSHDINDFKWNSFNS